MIKSGAYHLRRLAVILNDSNDAITVQDLHGDILAWNKGAEKMYGYTENEALGMNIMDLMPSELKQEYLDYLRAISDGELVESFETRRIAKSGDVLDVWLVITCLRDDEGEVDSIASTERDITAMKGELEKLRGFLPICAACKDIRDDAGYWQKIEQYISTHSGVLFSHGLCPKCAEKLYPGKHLYGETNEQGRDGK